MRPICGSRRRDGRFIREPDEILELDGHRRGEEGDVDEVALARVAGADECCEDAGGEQEARCEVRHRDPARAHGHVVAGGCVCGEEPGASLCDEVVRRGVRERPGGPEGADASDDERRLSRMDVLPGEPEPRCTRAREVVQDDVRAPPEPCARLEPVRGLEVDDDRALPAVQRDEVAPDSRSDRHHVAVSVTAGRLDLHDIGPQIGEEDTAQRPRDVLGVLDHAHAFERQAHLSPNPRRAMTTWRISAEPPEIVEPTDAR